MQIISPSHQTFTLSPGESLTVSADSISSGTVWRLGNSAGEAGLGGTDIGAGETKVFGAYNVTTRFDVVPTVGTLTAVQGLASPVTLESVQRGAYVAGTDTGSTDAYACDLTPTPSAYITGMEVHFKANTANTGACTLNLNSLGAKTIKKNKDSDLADADIKAGQWVHVVYDGTNWELLSPVSNAAGGVSTWEIKSADFTAVAGHRYQVDTSAGVVAATLPASASVGDEIPIEDATLSWATHNLTLNRNGLKVNGGTSNYTADVIGGKLSVVYISAGYGWSVK